jgi:signal transduction histidine kinase
MSLRLKYLLPLNLLILLVLAGHFYWTTSRVTHEFLTSEVTALEHLAVGLKYHLEHVVRDGMEIGEQQQHLERLARHTKGLDILIIDESYVVRAASNPRRMGLQWHEPGIQDVFLGHRLESWNLRGHTHDDRRAIDATVGVRDDFGRVRYAIHIARWLDDLAEAKARQLFGHLVSALVLLFAVTVAVNFLTYRLVLGPIGALRHEISRSGLLDEYPHVRAGDEISSFRSLVKLLLGGVRKSIGDLEQTIGLKQDALAEVSANRDALEGVVEKVTGELATTRERLARLERLAALGQLSAGLAHELRNPLHIVRATAETAMRRQPEIKEFSLDIIEEVDRIERLMEKLISYTHSTPIVREAVNLEALFDKIIQRLWPESKSQGNELGAKAPKVHVENEARWIEADPVLLEQAVMNLAANALEAGGPREQVELGASSDGQGGVEIAVLDRGPGLGNDIASRVFDPFFTRKAKGLGLGLPIVQKIADLHGGNIAIENRPEGGTVARLCLSRCVSGGKSDEQDPHRG